MTSAILTACFLFSATGYSSSPKNSSEMVQITQFTGCPNSLSREEREEQEPRSTAELISSPSFVINMPRDLLPTQEDKEIEEKTKQIYMSGAATTTLCVLTAYYACTTEPSEWLSGTAGSYCTNAVLTAMATNFLRRERNALQKKQAASKK